ncbi:AraC family transcriptional regulator [Nocardia beijingensis]|nr:AraC family transcriptional regulator [Nocardia beijingensis]
MLDLSCASSYLELWLTPLGAFSLLGPRGAAGSREPLISLSEISGWPGRELEEQLCAGQTWSDRFDLLDAFLLDHANCAKSFLPEVGRAWAMLVESGGTIPIGQVAKSVSWSHKHLITRFTQQIGLSPKIAARIIRFDRARRSLREYPSTALHEVASTCGYADQSHLNRDFRKFSGITPSTYMRHFRGGSGEQPDVFSEKGRSANEDCEIQSA